ADIRLHGNGAAARLLDLLDHSFGAGGVAIVVDRDLVLALRAKSCRRSADAPAAARYDENARHSVPRLTKPGRLSGRARIAYDWRRKKRTFVRAPQRLPYE